MANEVYESPECRHRHKCWACGCVWEHEDTGHG